MAIGSEPTHSVTTGPKQRLRQGPQRSPSCEQLSQRGHIQAAELLSGG